MQDHEIRARKSLGQNFLVDQGFVDRIVEAASITPEDTVVEIGPGTGALTRSLAGQAGRVVAIELDERLFLRLKSELADLQNLDLINGDALKFPFEKLPGPVKVVANLPYYISTPIITRLVAARANISLMVLMLQKEVAARISAPPGGKDYGYLSVMVQLHAEARTLFTVPAGAFRPVPKVDSAVISLRILKAPAVECRDYALYERVVGAAFSQRRKTLKNTLKASRLFMDEGIEGIASAGIDPHRRGETLSLAEFAKLTDFLFEFRQVR